MKEGNSFAIVISILWRMFILRGPFSLQCSGLHAVPAETCFVNELAGYAADAIKFIFHALFSRWMNATGIGHLAQLFSMLMCLPWSCNGVVHISGGFTGPSGSVLSWQLPALRCISSPEFSRLHRATRTMGPWSCAVGWSSTEVKSRLVFACSFGGYFWNYHRFWEGPL